MKYQISINQLVLAKTDLDLVDATILDYLIFYCNSQSPKIEKQRKIIDDDKYTWVNYDAIIEDMPLLRIQTKNSLTPRIHKIEKEGFIKTRIGQYSRMYVCLTDKIDTLFIISKYRQNDTWNISKYRQNDTWNTATDSPISKYRQNDTWNIYNNTNDNNTNIPEHKIQELKIKEFKRLPIEKMQPVHRMVYFLEDTLQTKIVNWGKQAKACSMILKAGYTEKQIMFTISFMAKSDFYNKKGFDLTTVANEIPRLKATIRKEVKN